jgi:uncharacterized metal-binding protein YceD (DUF177 family)
MSEEQQLEFSRPFDVAGVGTQEKRLVLEARPDERAALAKRFGLPEIARFVSEITLRRESSELIALEGTFEARLTQVCVITDEAFESEVKGVFKRRYLVGRAAEMPEEDIDPEADDPPEALGPEGLDLGEVAAEELSLALDPYPRKPGAKLEKSRYGESEEEAEEGKNPFAVLAGLKDRKPS